MILIAKMEEKERFSFVNGSRQDAKFVLRG
jgi:hypothetical protein